MWDKKIKFAIIANYWKFWAKSLIMGKNASIALGEHFEDFVKFRINEGRYKNASEVIRAGLRLFEEEEHRFYALKSAIQEGINSGIVEHFDPKEHLNKMKLDRSKHV